MGKQTKNTASKRIASKTIKQKVSASKKQNTFLSILALCGIALIVHLFLNITVNEAPKVVIDEGLYTNIARSLAWDGELAFRAQPINYPYLLYSFLLVPIYWLNRLCGGDVYRYVQVFNTLLAVSSVIPAYLFARDFTKDETKASATAILVTLMPDMLMGGYEMTECLIWPLSLWMVFFCYRYYTEQRLSDGLLTALFAGLMFACKPGAIAMGAALLVIYLFLSIVRKQNVLRALLPILTLALVVAVVYGIFLLLFDGTDSLLGLYEKQTEEWTSKDLWVAIEAFFLMIFLFVFACGGLFGLFPYTHLNEYDQNKRGFVIATAIGVLAVIAGTAVFVVPYKWTGELGQLPLHLRYCAMYIPLMYVFTVDLDSCSKKSKLFIVALIIFIVLSVFPGARAGFVPGKTNTIDSLALNAFAKSRNLNSTTTGWIVTVLSVAFSIAFLIIAITQKPSSQIRNKTLFGVANVFFVLFLLINSICAHVNANIYIDPGISADAAEVNQMIGSDRCLGITQRYYSDIYSYWLDGRLNVPMQQVTFDQMFIQMEETDGVYSPFVPVEQSPNVNNHSTPDTDKFVLGITVAEHLELSENIRSAEKTSNGHFTVVTIDPGERWLDSMLYGLDDNSLYPGESGFIHIFDGNRNVDGSLYLQITASGSGYLNINGERIALSEQVQVYDCKIPYTQLINLTAEDATVYIYGYSTQKK